LNLSSSIATTTVNLSSSVATTTLNLSSSVATTDANQNSRLTSLEGVSGSYATTGSNRFNGNQTITGSVIITENLQVFGSSSITYITASQLAVSSSIISVNVFEPSQRFGGIRIYDSGSSNATASFLWDSLNNRFIYENVDGAAYHGAMFIAGPRNSGSLGDETALTSGRIPKSVGGDHIDNSIMSESGGNTIAISGSLVITGSVLSLGTSLVSGSSQIDITATTNYTTFSSSISTSIGAFSSSAASYNLAQDNRLGSLELMSSSLSSATSSIQTRLGLIETSTGSLNTYTSSNNTVIGTLQTSTSSLNSYTSSNNTRIGVIETSTSSLNTFTSSAGGRLTSLESASSSIRTDFNSYTSSNNGRVNALETASGSAITRLGSLETASGSAITRLSSIEAVTGSIGTLNTYTGSNNTTNTTQNNRLDSIEGKTGSIALLNTYTGSNDTTNTAQNNRLTSIETMTGSLSAATSSIQGRLTSIEGVTGSITSLNTYTGSNNTVIGTLQTATSSLNSFTNSINTTIKTRLSAEGVISGSSQVLSGTGIWSSSLQLPSGVISGSAQVVSSLPAGTVSGSAQVISSLPSGTISGSIQVALTATTGFGTYINQALLTTSTPTFASVVSTGRMQVGGTDNRGVLTVQTGSTVTYVANTDMGDTGRFFVMENTDTSNTAGQFANITLQIAPTLSIGAGGRVLGDIRLIRTTTNSNAFYLFSAFRSDGTYKDYLNLDYTGATFSAGSTFNGQAFINSTGLGNSASLKINNSSASTFNHSIEAFTANMTTGQTNILVVGASGSTKNSGYIGYNWVSAASNSNYVSIGHWGNDHLLRIYGDGTVYMGTVTTGVWNGTTIAVANGGTGGTTAAAARTNLGLVIGTDVLAYRTFGTAAASATGDFATYNATHYVGTTAIAANRSSASQTLTGVSIDGNAATVTNATFYRQFTVRDDRSDGNDYSLANRPTGLYAIAGSGTNGPGSSYSSLIHVANGTDVAFQIAGGYTSDSMYFRGTSALQSGTGYSAWRTVIHSGNYGSYALPLNGGTMLGSISFTNTSSLGTQDASGTAWFRPRDPSNNLHIYTTSGGIYLDTNSNHYFRNAAGTGRLTLDTSGNATLAGVFTENSSLRYKKDIETIKYGLDKVLQMRGVTYVRKDSEVKEIGVIAEEMNEILPDIVLKNEEGQVDSVSYGRLSAVFIEAIKELKQEINEQNLIISDLKSKLDQ
jgi:hypothetical protein